MSAQYGKDRAVRPRPPSAAGGMIRRLDGQRPIEAQPSSQARGAADRAGRPSVALFRADSGVTPTTLSSCTRRLDCEGTWGVRSPSTDTLTSRRVRQA